MSRQKFRQSFSRRLAIESLESKQMLAGDVTVTQTGANLVIRGDEFANQLVITSGETAGSYVIRGLDGTTVTLEGSSTPAPQTGLVVAGVRGFVHVETGEGNDEVFVEDAAFLRSLTLRTGNGNDEVVVQGASIRGLLSIVAGEGNDTVEVGEATTPETAPTAAADSNVQGGLAIDILLGDGADSVEVHSAAAKGAIVVDGGLGADQIDVSDVRAAVLTLRGGDGDAIDEIDVARAKAFAAIIGAGAGADRVGVVDAAFTSLNVFLGSGDDNLSLQKATSRLTLLVGGEGTADRYTDAGENALARKLVVGFELPADVNTQAPTFPRLRDLLSRIRGLIRR